MIDANEVIERLCKLQGEVYQHIDCESADCFCGKGGFWGMKDYGGTYEEGYRNSGEALEFIEEAVRAAIKQKIKTKKGL